MDISQHVVVGRVGKQLKLACLTPTWHSSLGISWKLWKISYIQLLSSLWNICSRTNLNRRSHTLPCQLWMIQARTSGITCCPWLLSNLWFVLWGIFSIELQESKNVQLKYQVHVFNNINSKVDWCHVFSTWKGVYHLPCFVFFSEDDIDLLLRNGHNSSTYIFMRLDGTQQASRKTFLAYYTTSFVCYLKIICSCNRHDICSTNVSQEHKKRDLCSFFLASGRKKKYTLCHCHIVQHHP